MNLEQTHAVPLAHISPILWQTTKSAHITLTAIGSLLLLPAASVFYSLWQVANYTDSLLDSEFILPFGSALIGTFSGCFAWCGLCLLFFMRCDVRCHQIVWRLCAAFGYLTIPCAGGWIFWMLSEGAPPLLTFILLAILGASIACARLGTRYSRLAGAQFRINQRARREHQALHGE